MALYQSQSNQNQMFGVPGSMYMPPSQPTKMQPQAAQQQGYQMYNGAMMAFPQQQQMNMQMNYGQQQFMTQPQHLQVLQEGWHSASLEFRIAMQT